MDKYRKIISELSNSGVEFDTGMSRDEIENAEILYNISFPFELKNLFSIGLPTSKGFYNWRDMSVANVNDIKDMLIKPILGLQNDLKDDFESNGYPCADFWCDGWGEKPNDFKKAQEILMKHYAYAPPLIPVYSHRYIPFVSDSEEVPVFSIIRADIICYGENLISYLETEFKMKKYDNNMHCRYVDFWSDLL